MTFEFRNVPPGTYLLKGADGGRLSTVRIEDHDIAGLVIPARVSIDGRVTIEESSNLLPPQMLLNLTGPDGETIRFNIIGRVSGLTADGAEETFKIALKEGEYRTSLGVVTPPFVVKSITYGSVDLLSQPLTVGASSLQQIRIVIGKN